MAVHAHYSLRYLARGPRARALSRTLRRPGCNVASSAINPQISARDQPRGHNFIAYRSACRAHPDRRALIRAFAPDPIKTFKRKKKERVQLRVDDMKSASTGDVTHCDH